MPESSQNEETAEREPTGPDSPPVPAHRHARSRLVGVAALQARQPRPSRGTHAYRTMRHAAHHLRDERVLRLVATTGLDAVLTITA